MKILIVVIVHNRWNNIERWLRVWNCTVHEESLCVVRNVSGISASTVTENELFRFIERPNVGMDIGVMQDIIRGRLSVPEWDWLFIAPDDFIPMDPDFMRPFRELAAMPNTGLVGSRANNTWDHPKHCRTGGFMIRRDVAEKLVFPADPIVDREQCLTFEHRHDNMMQQVLRLGFDVRFLEGLNATVLWDSGHESGHNRWLQMPTANICEVLAVHGSDKQTIHSYGEIYEAVFSGRKHRPEPVLEIGVRFGQSLRAWRDYFEVAEIHGIDIDPLSMLTNEKRITTHLMSVLDAVALTKLAKTHGPFQAIIDDGSHNSVDVLAAYGVLRNFLAVGGLYIIEDVPNQTMIDMHRDWPGATCYDRRGKQGRYDDVIVVIQC